MTRIVWGIIGLVAAAQFASAGAKDYFSEFEKDFGTSPRGTVLQHYFMITNTTQQPVQIGQARVSCGCVSAKVLNNVLKPGESTAVFAAMDTRRIPTAGMLKEVTIYVPFFAPTMEEVSMKVRTITRDDLVMTPDNQGFGNVAKGKEAKSTVKVTLYNHPQWKITEAAATGKFLKPEFKLLSQTPTETTYEVTTALEKDCEIGNWASEVWLKTNTPGIEKIRVPITVNVTAPISITPEAVQVNNATIGKENEARVMLSGTQAFKILSVKGVDDIVGVKAGSEDARPVHTLTITVKPKAGDVNTLLEITTDSKDMPTISVPVRAQVKGK